MTPAKTSTVITITSLLVAGFFFCWGKNIKPPIENTLINQMWGGKDETRQCSAVKKEVFVDGRRLYWGNLGELTKPERFFSPRTVIQTASTAYAPTRGDEAQQFFLQELRTALKAFEKRYCLKIIWRKADLTLPVVTAQFIDFWDKEFGNMKEKGQSQ